MTAALHIRMAEALGWRLVPLPTAKTSCQWGGSKRAWVSPQGRELCEACQSDDLPRYDTSWAETGPLIEKYGIGLSLGYKLSDPPQPGQTWVATPWDYTLKGFPGEHVFADGDSPLRAVCALLLMLAEAGKLEER